MSYRGGLEGVWESETSGGCSPVDLFVYLLIVSEREPPHACQQGQFLRALIGKSYLSVQ